MDANKISFLNQIIGLLPDCICLDVKRYIACQFALESDFGESPMALCLNNYCGMKVAKLRITLAMNLDEVLKFAKYSGIYSCVLDYLLWLQSNRFTRQELNTLELFIKHLYLSRYCPEPGYENKINTLYKQYYE
ncbi:mannosyl-glycoprotein endo-beta-N-acetylglucosaminidase [Cooperia oncophora]